MAASSHKNFRLRGIPLEYENRNEVCSLIQKTLALESNVSPTVYSLACSPTDPNSKIATVSFPSIPDCLSDRSRVEWDFNLPEDNGIDFGRSLAFDTHFTGFTPFHRTSDRDCHIDLGGLVIKETVRILKEEPLEPDFSILNAVSGFAFFGVPHRGLAVECLVPLVKDNPNRALLESLNKNSPLLERLQTEFDKISNARSSPVISFYETEKSPTGAWVNGKWEMSGPSAVLVEVFSATCGCQKQHPINRNHSEMVKYSGVHDQLYRRVIVALRPILGISRGRPGTGGIGRGPQVRLQLSGDEQECLKSLSFPEQEHRYFEISYANDTCQWLLEDHKFQTWMSASRGLFWVKGYPGTGKSVLMKFAVDMMNRRISGEVIVSFFIHGRGVPLQKTALGMFRAILNSLLRSFPTYFTELTERFRDQQQRYGSYEQKGGWRWNEKELERFLARLLVKGTKDHPVVIFVDALDECAEEDAKRILAYFKDIIGDAEREKSLLRICFSSRHFPILGHETMSNIYVEQRNDKDIRLVVESRLKDIKPDGKRQEIENEILLKSRGGFQWAVLTTNIIRDQDATGARTHDLLKTISSIPPGLDELYSFILRGATKDMNRQMTKLFQWVLFAQRPLSAQELREALATDKDMAFMTLSQLRLQGSWSDDVSQFEKRVRHVSRGLVEFQDRDVYEQYEPGGEEWSREAQFIHQSAADFVIEKFLPKVHERSATASPAGAGNFEISRSFLRYLALGEILNEGNMSRKQLSVTFPLLPYGVAFLLDHIRVVEGEGIPQIDLISLIQWDRPERLRLLACRWRIMDPDSTHAPRGWPFLNATVLHLVIALGSVTLLDALLQKSTSNLDTQDLEGNTLLHLALRENRQDLARMILERSMIWQTEHDLSSTDQPDELGIQRKKYLGHVNTTNLDGDTPLNLAVSIGADKIIRSLIDAGAEVKHEKSLLFYAISREDRTLVSSLIEKGADLEGAVYFSIQCLEQANHPHGGLHGLLKDLLVAKAGRSRYDGPDVGDFGEWNESDEELDDLVRYEDAIFLASRNGSTEAVNLLLSHDLTYGTSARLRNANGDVPLQLAIIFRHLETAEVLLRAFPGAVLSQNNRGETALDAAILQDQLEGVQLLLGDGCGPLTIQVLYRVVAGNHVELTKAFLQKDGDVIQLANQSHGDFDAPFIVAVRERYHEMVKLLLDTGKIDLSIRDASGSTPLHWAIRVRDITLVNLLLDTGQVDLTQKDGDGNTPLLSAFQSEDEGIVRVFLERGIINLRQSEDWGDIPPWWSIIDINYQMMRLVIDRLWALEYSPVVLAGPLLQYIRFDMSREDEELDWRAFWWAFRREGLI
ncbi:hypothetical protein LZL87_010546 [Fusarium oxysporum]|nr:hypothetical protein LZL87_010546 [Fusarium oxysporum]